MSLLDRFWREPVRRTVLPNGLTVIVKRDASAALASVQVWVKTGSIHEGGSLGAGLSHYLEHMLFKGTERRAGREISATVQAHGGYINAYTTFDRTVYYIDLPSEHAGVALDLLSDAVLRSTLPADEAVKEKEVILREIAMTRDDPDDRLWQAVFATVFREHPYRLPVIGHRELFERATAADLTAYYRARYVPNNLVVVVVGDVDPDATVREVTDRFGGFARGNLAPVLVPAEPAQLGARELHLREEVEVVRAAVSWQVPGLTHPDAPVLDLLAMVLGHGDSSILWQELREKAALVHSVDASCWNPGSSGVFCISYTTDGPKREPAEQALHRLLERRARGGFTAAQVRQAVRQLVAGEVASRQTMSGQASKLGAAEVVAGDLRFSEHYFERLERATPADLVRVLREYLRSENRTTVSSSPPEAAPVEGAAAASGARRARKLPSGARRKGRTAAVAAAGEFEELRLRNGVRLLVLRDPRLPQVHFRMVWQGGPAYEKAGRCGSTALMSTLLAKDTRRRSAAEVAGFIESVGGSFHPFCGNNSFGVAAEVLAPDWKRALSVVADAALRPAFRTAAVALERDAQLAGLRQDADDVVTEARKLLRERFFGSHPLAFDAHGRIDTVEKLSVADLQELHGRLTRAGNLVLAVAGDFDVRAVRAEAERALAGFGPGSVRAPATELRLRPGAEVEKRPKEQAVVLRGYPGPALHAADFHVGEVADELFSGMASQLFERVREQKGLAYFVRSSRVTGLDAAMFSFLAGTRPGREQEVLAEIDLELERVRLGRVEEKELQRCQARLKAGRRQSLQTNGARALQAALNTLQGKPLNDWKNYDARIAAVTVADLAAFAQTYLVPDKCTQLLVSPP